MTDPCRHLPLPVMVVGLMLAVTAVAGAAWFVISAWKLASPNRGIVAVILLLVGSILAVVVALLRTRSFSGTAAMDVSAIYDQLHRTEKSLRVIRLGRGVVGLVCAGLVLFWIVQAMAMARMLEFLLPSSIIAALTACFYLPWLRDGERRLYERHAAVLQRLRDLKENSL